MMEIEDREDEWGSWECPVCGADHEDPSSIVETTCGTCNTTVTLSYPDDDGRIIAYVQSQREKAINEPEIPINFCDEFDVPRQAYRDIAKQLDTLKRQLADIRPVIEALADMDSMWRKSIPSYAQDPGHHVIDCLTYGHLQVAGEWMKKYGTGTAVPNEPDPPYPHRTRVCSGCGTAVDEDDLADGNLCHICIKR